MNNIKLAFGVYLNSKRGIHSIDNIILVVKKIEKLIGRYVTNFTVCYRCNGKEKVSAFKYTARNKEKLSNIAISEISLISFCELKKSNDYADTVFSLNFSLDFKENMLSAFTLIMDANLLSNKVSYENIVEIMKSVRIEDVTYFFDVVFPIDNDKMPDFFLMGIGSPKLSAKEKEEVRVLSLNISQYSNKIWDIFWINTIREEYVDKDLIKDIESIVSTDNILKIPGMFVFKLPLTYEDYINNEKLREKYRNELRMVLCRRQLVM